MDKSIRHDIYRCLTTIITLSFRTPYVFGHPLFFTEIIIFCVPYVSDIWKIWIFSVVFVFGHLHFFTSVCLIRRKEKICLVPVTWPYLFFSPDHKLFFSFEYEKFGPILYSIFKRIVKNILKRSCKHSKNKTKLDNFS